MACDNAVMNPINNSLWPAMATPTCQSTLACRNAGKSASGSAMSLFALSSTARSSSVRLRAASSAQNGSNASRVSIRSANLIFWPRIIKVTELAIDFVVGRWTKAPPARPALTRTRFCTSKIRRASRTVARLICVCLTSSRYAGSAVPSVSSPLRIRSRSSRASTSDALGTSTGLSKTLERVEVEFNSTGAIVAPPHTFGLKVRPNVPVRSLQRLTGDAGSACWPWCPGSILAREVPLDVVLAEQFVTCRMVHLVGLLRPSRTPALQARIDKQQEQAYRAHADARPRDEAAIKPGNTKCAVPWVTRCGSAGEQCGDQPHDAHD